MNLSNMAKRAIVTIQYAMGDFLLIKNRADYTKTRLCAINPSSMSLSWYQQLPFRETLLAKQLEKQNKNIPDAHISYPPTDLTFITLQE